MSSINKVFGYARVSSDDQNEGRQVEALIAAGIDERFIFVDKASGKDFNRSEYQVLIRALREGDTLIIKSIERLDRNYNEITAQWHAARAYLFFHFNIIRYRQFSDCLFIEFGIL